jgi:anti-repressor protein
MNEIVIFENPEFGKVRVISVEDKPYFCGADVAKALGYAIPTKAVNTHCKGVSKIETPTRGGKQEMIFIPESDVYRLVMRSKLPDAERFQDWVVEEVLPSIRKSGGYITGQEEMSDLELVSKAFLVVNRQLEERNKTIALQDQEIEKQKKKIEKLEPKAKFADAIGSADNCISVGEMAKLLCQNGFQTGQRRLFDRLRNEGYIMRNAQGRYIPMQMSMNLGIMRIEESLWVFDNKAISIPTIRITPKGKQYFINRYVHNQIPAI